MPMSYTSSLRALMEHDRTNIVAALKRNYPGISAELRDDDLHLSSDQHDESFLRSALVSELATVKVIREAAQLRSALFGYLLG